ncbi:AAA family ATPase [Sinomicrobium weinanense]|uniref:AAA family ATPase n=1 Tax=Sinomicrobium weinanense TaxID=2842200 RepID=A0A926JWE1_9FLAO|nr:AAA family ATPase [Sinomicrobium weinanense]MBC9798396.1 AAA family ATPase [Sinomicrobium weinanense]MBU3122589.1 AAA family ATPase [Sinomicrobium weinanense]
MPINQQKHRFYVMTGGPGVGKTTTLLALQKHGYDHVPEVARQVIREQMAQDGDALPWKNTEKYRDLMLSRSVDSYLSALEKQAEKPLFFDRGIPDTLAYSYLEDIPVSDELKEGLQDYRYRSEVFIFPPWEEIYKTDGERKQDFEEAVRTYEVMAEAYTRQGYELLVVPKTDVEERVKFILNHLNT